MGPIKQVVLQQIYSKSLGDESIPTNSRTQSSFYSLSRSLAFWQPHILSHATQIPSNLNFGLVSEPDRPYSFHFWSGNFNPFHKHIPTSVRWPLRTLPRMPLSLSSSTKTFWLLPSSAPRIIRAAPMLLTHWSGGKAWCHSILYRSFSLRKQTNELVFCL